MIEAEGLEARKGLLDSVGEQVRERVEQFEDSIADLRREHERLRVEYANALRSELERVDPDPAASPPALTRILTALEKTQQPVLVRRMREFAASRGRLSTP